MPSINASSVLFAFLLARGMAAPVPGTNRIPEGAVAPVDDTTVVFPPGWQRTHFVEHKSETEKRETDVLVQRTAEAEAAPELTIRAPTPNNEKSPVPPPKAGAWDYGGGCTVM